MADLTVRQQQHRQQQLTASPPPTDHSLARHALDFYFQCVAAGQWACVNVERLQDGDCISFSSRPWAAAETAARVHPGERRRSGRPNNERRRQRKQLWLQSRCGTAAVSSAHQRQASTARQRQQGPSCGQQPPRRQSPADGVAGGQQPEREGTAAAATYTQAAPNGHVFDDTATVAAEGPAPDGPPPAVEKEVLFCSRPATPPRMTRGRKRRKETTPENVAHFAQLDGEAGSPPPSPRESPPSPAFVQRCAVPAAREDSPGRPGKPPPPPPPHGRTSCPAIGNKWSANTA